MESKYIIHPEYLTLSSGPVVYVEKIIRTTNHDAPWILFVNGVLATTTSFYWAINMLPNHNLIFYDPPRAGKSLEKNNSVDDFPIDIDVLALTELNERYSPFGILSMSWGGFAALLMLGLRPGNIRRAVIASFSDKITPAMSDYLATIGPLIHSRRISEAGDLFCHTLGRYLPNRYKRGYVRYFAKLTEPAFDHLIKHFDYLFGLKPETYTTTLPKIWCDCLFINGGLDLYTSPNDAQNLAALVPRSRTVVVPGAGHFLSMENVDTFRNVEIALREFFSSYDTGSRTSTDLRPRTRQSVTPAVS